MSAMLNRLCVNELTRLNNPILTLVLKAEEQDSPLCD